MRKDVIHIGLQKRFVGWVLGSLAGLWKLSRRVRRLTLRGPSLEKKVLILEPFGMGDLVTLEPLIRNLRGRGYRVHLVGRGAWRALYPEGTVSAWSDSAVPWADHDDRAKYRWSAFQRGPFREFLRSFRGTGDKAVGIDPRGDIRSVLLLYWAGCPRVLTLENYLGSDLRIPGFAAEGLGCENRFKRWEQNLQFLRLLNEEQPWDESPPRLDHWLVTDRPSSRRVGLNPVAPWRGKWWRAEKWSQLAAQLQAEGWEVVGLAGPGQRATAKEQLGTDVPVEESHTLQALADVLSTLECLVTVDSGPMHLADAIGVPVVALFGQGKLPLWAPSGPRSRVISHQADPDFFVCHPIEQNVPLGRKFMDRITVAEVLAGLHSVCRP